MPGSQLTQAKRKSATREELPQFECDVPLFPLAITGCCVKILSLSPSMTLSLEQSNLAQISKDAL